MSSVPAASSEPGRTCQGALSRASALAAVRIHTVVPEARASPPPGRWRLPRPAGPEPAEGGRPPRRTDRPPRRRRRRTVGWSSPAQTPNTRTTAPPRTAAWPRRIPCVSPPADRPAAPTARWPARRPQQVSHRRQPAPTAVPRDQPDDRHHRPQPRPAAGFVDDAARRPSVASRAAVRFARLRLPRHPGLDGDGGLLALLAHRVSLAPSVTRDLRRPDALGNEGPQGRQQRGHLVGRQVGAEADMGRSVREIADGAIP